MVAESKKFALLMAARDTDYVKQVHGGYFNVFVQAFGEEGETWDVFRVIDGDFPAEAEVDCYDGFVISGSPFDAFGDDPWVLHLCNLLRTVHYKEKKILGICFGHQVLSRALGGKVERSRTGWDIGVRTVTLMKGCKFIREDDNPPFTQSSLNIIECHRDEVIELPEGSQVLAFSEKTNVEMFAISDHILGIQGHPEYNTDILMHLIGRLVNNKSIEKELVEQVSIELEKVQPERERWKRICNNFLKGR